MESVHVSLEKARDRNSNTKYFIYTDNNTIYTENEI